jgi:hydroxymethylglutaryl-CoA reductase
MTTERGSRLPGFHELAVAERQARIAALADLTAEERALLASESPLALDTAARLTENTIAVYALPLGLALNFIVNRRDVLVPMVTEEPSVIAAASNAARLARGAGGFEAESDPACMIAQIQLLDVPDPEAAVQRLVAASERIGALVDELEPGMARRGGGARGVEARVVDAPEGRRFVVVHLLVDVGDAMGANAINTIAEGAAPLVAEIAGGRSHLRILSNLTDRRRARARVRYRFADLATAEREGRQVAEAIELASLFAEGDPYRAATHNKGIMNGIDAVALATGNDWRALEAGAHAYAARGGSYGALATWRVDGDGLLGRIELPLAVGTAGAQAARRGRCARARLCDGRGRPGAELRRAARARDRRHPARSHVAPRARGRDRGGRAAGAGRSDRRGADRGRRDQGRARPCALRRARARRRRSRRPRPRDVSALRGQALSRARGEANGKVILLGEHAVVHGQPAIVVGLELGVRIEVEPLDAGPRRGPGGDPRLEQMIDAAAARLGIPAAASFAVAIGGELPVAIGLGSSAALCVALVRALAAASELRISPAEVAAHAHALEGIGTPSGVDSTAATYGGVLWFLAGPPPAHEPIRLRRDLGLVIALSGTRHETGRTVGGLRQRVAARPDVYRPVLKAIGALVVSARRALEEGDHELLGELMNMNHALLAACAVSTPQLEETVEMARCCGALGAKLTGGGGGGAVVALAPADPHDLAAALRDQGCEAFATRIAATSA